MSGESGIQNDVPVINEIINPQKIFRVSPDFGIHSDLSDQINVILDDTDSDHESNIIEVFENQGFTVVRGGNFNPDNPLEIGINTSSDELGLNSLQRNRRVAEASGAIMPLEYNLSEVIDSQIPIVAKDLTADRGTSKYLLDTKAQKVRFLTWMLLGYNLGNLYEMDNPKGIIERLMTQVQNKQFTHPLFTPDFSPKWYFEKYIETPSSYNTSFRILADAFGKIHYAVLIRSQNEKGALKLRDSDSGDMDPLKYMSLGGVSWQMLLHEPRSPFYIGAKIIVSNAAQGGKILRLNGVRVTDNVDRTILSDHDLNPDNPVLPSELESQAIKLGIESRRDYPYIGADFLKQKEDGYFFMEANLGPGIDNESVGISKTMPPFESELAMIEKVISTI